MTIDTDIKTAIHTYVNSTSPYHAGHFYNNIDTCHFIR